MSLRQSQFVRTGSAPIAGRLGGSAPIAVVSGEDRSVTLFRYDHPSSRSELCNHPTDVEAMAFDKHCTALATGCSGGSVWLWDVSTGSQTTSLSGHRSNCQVIEYHSFGSFFATGSADTHIKIWDARQSRCVQTYRGHASCVSALKFSPHGKWLVGADEEGLIKVWDLTAGKCLSTLESHTDRVTSLDFHPTDFFLLSGGDDACVKIWNCEKSFELATSSAIDYSSISHVKFSGDGNGIFVTNGLGMKQFALNTKMHQVTCVRSDSIQWERGIADLTLSGEGHVEALSRGADGFSLWTSAPLPEPDEKTHNEVIPVVSPMVERQSFRSIRSRVKAADRMRSLAKENFDPVDMIDPSTPRDLREVDRPSAPSIAPLSSRGNSGEGSGSISSVLSRRLESIQQICTLWSDGNSRSAVDEAISSSDQVVFLNLLAVLPSERTKTALSIDSCGKILRHILESCILAFPSDEHKGSSALTDSRSPESPESIYVMSTATTAVVYLAKRFGSILLDLRRAGATMIGTDLTREERIEKANACIDLFERVIETLRNAGLGNKALRTQREESLAELRSIIQI